MNIIPYILFSSVFFLDFLSEDLGILPRQTTWFPELLSGFVLLLVIAHAALKKSIVIHPKYVILFVIFLLQLLAGIILNSVEPGTVFAGIRYYFKYAPLFLLPIVYSYSDKEMKGQLKFFLALALIQFPVVIYQYFIFDDPLHTIQDPDLVSGTVQVGSILSIYLVSAISILLGFYIKQKIKFVHFFILTLFLFIPTTLNETKGTLILLPISIIVIVLTSRVLRENSKQLIPILAILPILFGTFLLVYNTYFAQGATRERGLVAFFTDPEKGIKHYLYTGDAEVIDAKAVLRRGKVVVGQKTGSDVDTGSIRRIDAAILPFRVLSSEPSKLLLGLGIGNVSESFIDRFSGEYRDIKDMSHTQIELASMVWEIGVLGLFTFLLFFYFIYKDAKNLSRNNTLPGIIATGWTGVVVILVLTMPYKNFMIFNVIGFLFWYFSGYVAAKNLSVNNSSESSRM